MFGISAHYFFLLMMWSVMTVTGLVLFSFHPKKIWLVLSPLLAIMGSGWALWHHPQSDGPLNIGLFFLFTLCLMHLLFIMMINSYATPLRVKAIGAASMLIMGWAYFVNDPWVFSILWGVSVIPQVISFWPEQVRARNIYIGHHVLSFVLLLVGLNFLSSTSALPIDLSSIEQLSHGRVEHILVGCLVLAAFIRQGVFPFHLWFKAGYKTLPFPLNIGLYIGNLGFFFFVKTIMPLLQGAFTDFFPYVMVWGIVSGLYFANMSLVQGKIRSTVFYVMLAQFSILFCGLDSASITGKSGVLFQFLSLGLSFSGLIACLYILEWNVGELHSRRFHGLQQNNGTLSVFFLLFSLCAVSMPLTMGFAGEDLIFHAVIEKYPFVGLGLILTACLNGISLFKVVTFLFRGTRYDSRDDRIEFGIWQKAALGILLVLLFGFGLFPNLLLRHVLSFI
jgi:NADH-quinone oxidoreductase subunit M